MTDKQTTAYYTVVFRVAGEKCAHDEWWKSMQPMWMAADKPVSISAISRADDITRLNCIEEVAERHGGDAHGMVEEIRDLIVHPDPIAWWKENHTDE